MKHLHTLSALLMAGLISGLVACTPAPTQLTVKGEVIDATMNNIILKTAEGDTLFISTMDTDPAKVPGVLLGDVVVATYEIESLEGEEKINQAVGLVITQHSPYYYIAGTWTEPNPIDTEVMQGVTLNSDGSAESVGMETLLFKSWVMDGNTLMLTSESIGNKQTFTGTDTLLIERLDQDSLILASPHGDVVWAFGRQK